MKKTTRYLLLTIMILIVVTLAGCTVNPGAENQQDTYFPAYMPDVVPTDIPSPEPTDDDLYDWSDYFDPYQTSALVNASNPVTDSPVPNANTISFTIPLKAQDGEDQSTDDPSNKTLTAPTKVPTATPVGVLKLGSEGSSVKQVQQRLKDLGFLTGTVDGVFGLATENAVKGFQAQYKMNVDGVVGPDTLNRLASARATAVPTPVPTGAPTATPLVSQNVYLKKGNTGTRVTQMQERLIDLGYLAGAANAKFDSATELAVIAFQKRNCSYSDGIAGPTTLTALYSKSAKAATSVAGVTGVTLKEGSEGKAVSAVQTKLKALGYLTGSVDGSFGAATTSAIKAFQKANGLTVDGMVGGGTLEKLYSGNAIASTGATSAPTGTKTNTTTIPNYSNTYLQKGNSGATVKQLQERLIALGYLAGTPTSQFDSATRLAVIAFQARTGVLADGVAGPDTLSALFSSSARSTSTAVGVVGITLTEESNGKAVTCVQSALKGLGYYTGSLDGIWGSATETAVRMFQKNNNLTIDGLAGGETLEKLFSGNAKAASGATAVKTNAPAAATATPNYNNVYLQKGSDGSQVNSLQKRLISLGYMYGTATSNYDSATASAVRSFQSRSGLKADGIAGPDTLQLLYSSSAKTTSTVAGIVGTTLEIGNTGRGVSAVQSLLKNLGYYSGQLDGTFGVSTEEAVRAFQKNNGLTVDGRAGASTFEKLYSGTAKKANGTTATPVKTSAPTATPSYSDQTYLKKGQNNARVKQMQERLISLGYLAGTATSYFDSATEKAVIAFQKRNAAIADGIAGPDTLSALYSTSAKKATSVAGIIGISLKQDSTGSAVSAIQTELKALGYYTGVVDGKFGEATALAVRAFQNNNGLTVDGNVGTTTLEKIYSGTAKKANGATPTPTAAVHAATATPAFSDKTYLQKGQNTVRIKQMQERLISLGYLVGTANGNFDSATEAAVIAFQKRVGILADGVAGPDTLMALYSDSPKKANGVSGVIGVTLKQNDTGTSVTELQKQLKALGYYTGSTDGIYGVTTTAAVKEFQKNNNMNTTGTVTSAMLEKIYSGSAKKANGTTPTPTATKVPSATATPAFSDQTYLKKGQNTNRIKQMQERLISLGYLAGTANGNFDSATEAAVIAFQKRTGVYADGIAGPDTLSALYSESPKKANAIAGVIGVTLNKNSSGTAVTELQKQLKALGYYTSSLDGIFGDSTTAAVNAFQKNNGMTANGTVNATMLEKIYSGSAKKANGTTPTPKVTAVPPATATPYFSDKTFIKKGESSNRVSVLQERLIALGYLAGKPDNDFDSATEAAVIAFQKKHSMFADGIAGPDTLAILYSSSAKKASSVAGVIGVTIKENETGNEVKLVQQSLKSLGYYTGTADGVFGSTTKAAVIAFQKNNGLKTDGTIGSSTLEMIYSGKAKAASGATATPIKTSTPKPTATPKATATPKPTATPAYDANTYLQLGNSGKNVKQMQERLIDLGYLAGSATSKFDEATEAAVIAFQKKNCAYYDGIAGILTLDALYSASPKKATSVSGVVGVTLKEGDEGNAVSGVQIRLKELGYYKGVADGKYGATTTMAVVAFQAANGVKADGSVGTSTLEKMYSETVVDSKQANATPTPLPTSNPEAYVTVTTAPGESYATLTRGMRGTPVKVMQQALYTQGYYKGAVDGMFGADTEEAVKAFQRSHNLTVNGVAATATLRALLEGNYPDRS